MRMQAAREWILGFAALSAVAGAMDPETVKKGPGFHVMPLGACVRSDTLPEKVITSADVFTDHRRDYSFKFSYVTVRRERVIYFDSSSNKLANEVFEGEEGLITESFKAGEYGEVRILEMLNSINSRISALRKIVCPD